MMTIIDNKPSWIDMGVPKGGIKGLRCESLSKCETLVDDKKYIQYRTARAILLIDLTGNFRNDHNSL